MTVDEKVEGTEGEEFEGSRKRRWVANLFLLVASVVVAVLLAETLLRFTYIPSVPTLPHPLYHHTRPTDSPYRWVSPRGEFDTTVAFNSLALRGSEPDFSKDHLWVFMGDSLVEGLQVSEESTVSSWMQRELGEGYTVLNAGVGGYSPVLMSLRLPEILERMAPRKPEKVLLGLFPNDLEEEYLYRSIAYKNSKGKVIAVTPGVLRGPIGRFRTRLFQHSVTFQIIQKSLVTRKGERKQAKVDPYLPSESVIYPFRSRWTEAERKIWAQLFRSIGNIYRLCHSKDIDLVVVVIPPGHQIGPDVWKTGKQEMNFPSDFQVESTSFQDEIFHRAERIGVRTIDLLPDFKEHPSPQDLYFDFDGHWTAEGNQFAAEMILKKLSDEEESSQSN